MFKTERPLLQDYFVARKIKDHVTRWMSGWNPIELQQLVKNLKKKSDESGSALTDQKKIQRASLIGEQLKALLDGSTVEDGSQAIQAKKLAELAEGLSTSSMTKIDLQFNEVHKKLCMHRVAVYSLRHC